MTEKLANRRFAELERIFAGGKASHAYLFLGPLNAENETGIRRLAQTLLCEGEREKPCGRCRTCRLMEQGSHPDFRVLAPEGGKIKLEEVRQLCYDALLNPYLSAGKVYFFQQFELLTEVAANAFLKTLEEPPPAVYFLALAEDERGVLPRSVPGCTGCSWAVLVWRAVFPKTTVLISRCPIWVRFCGGRNS